MWTLPNIITVVRICFTPVIALLPGSRRQEADKLLPIMFEAADLVLEILGSRVDGHTEMECRWRPDRLPADIENRLIGEMTGADRALVSSLEGFEDLQLIGKLQLEDHGVTRGDVVICVTEGGETSSVIGTVLAALRQYGDLDEARRAEARNHLYFVYNNPDEALRPFERSASVTRPTSSRSTEGS